VLLWLAAEGIARRRWPPLARLAWNPGVIAALALIGGWLGALGQRAGWSSVHEAAVRQNFDRYMDAWNNVQAWWFYGVQTPADLFPWVFFLPAALLLVFRRRAPGEGEEATIAARTLALFPLFGLLFFSLSSGKRGVYVIEVFPAISLLIAAAVVRHGWGRLGLVLLLAAGLVLGLGIPAAVTAGIAPVPAALVAAAGLVGAGALLLSGLALAAAAAAGLMFLRRGMNAAALASAVAGTLAVFLLAGAIGGATWTRLQQARLFSTTMAAAAPPGARIAVEAANFEQLML
jgi:hypothetical protein